MRAIDANKIEYGYLWKKKDGTVHSPAFAFKEDIDKQPELPTMQSNKMCDYCRMSESCDWNNNCGGVGFVGITVIEVEDDD